MNVLITGGLGKTAEPLTALFLHNDYDVTILDVREDCQYVLDKKIKVIRKDVCDYDAIGEAFHGMDTVIHLAVNVIRTCDSELSFQTNVFGTYNVLMRAKHNNAKKVLLASSAPVHNADRLRELKRLGRCVDYLCSSDNDFTYDLTKNIQELIAQQFALTYSMDVMVLRLGHVVDGASKTDVHGGPLSELIYCRGGWVCKYDVAKAFLKAAETDFTGFHLINVIGARQYSDCFDVSSAKDIIDFECGETFLDYSS